MALQGTLRDFSIGEIFQLIGQQQKTGVLTVTHDESDVHVIFDNGRVVGAAEGEHGEDDRVLQRLGRMQLLRKDSMRGLQEAQGVSLSRMAAFFESQGGLTREDLSQFLHLEIQNILLQLFLLEDGQYMFHARSVRYDKEFTSGVSAEEVLLDGLRAKDEWSTIERAIPNLAAVPEKTDPNPETNIEGAIGEVERGIYDLVDGTRNLREILDQGRISDFEASSILANLVEQGYIKVETRSGIGSRPAGWRERFPLSALAACAVSVVGCGLIAGALLGGILGNVREKAAVTLHGFDAGGVLASNRNARVRAALELYRVETGGYPDRLEALVTSGIVSEGDISTSVYYKVRGREYALLVPGG